MTTSLAQKIVNATLLLGPIVAAFVAAAAVRAAEPGPTVTITAIDDKASEAGHVAILLATRDGGAIEKPLVVPIKLGGTATPGADYASPGPSITFPAQTPMVMLKITPIADAITEGTETVVVTLVPNAGAYTLGEEKSATATITDASSSASGGASHPNKDTPPPHGPPDRNDPTGVAKPIGTLAVEITLDGQGSWKHPSNGTWAQMRFHRALSYSIPLDGYVGAGSGFTQIDRREVRPALALPNFQRYVVLEPRAAMSADLSGPCGKGESQILDEYKGTEVGDPGQPPIVPYTETWKGGGPFPSGDKTLSERNLCMTRFALDNDRHVVHIALDGADSEVKTHVVHNGFEARPFNVHLHGDSMNGSSALEKLTFFDVPVPAGAKSFEFSRVIENFSETMGKGRTMVPLRATVKWRVTLQ